ncbi:hypothetical protein [Microcystis aeruginosa]|nr:hypothetical protein [Microcystis aeruginosa]
MTEINSPKILTRLTQHPPTSHSYKNLKNSLAAADWFETDLNQ